eukprot:4839036-Amphidinium_carterae.1
MLGKGGQGAASAVARHWGMDLMVLMTSAGENLNASGMSGTHDSSARPLGVTFVRSAKSPTWATSPKTAEK